MNSQNRPCLESDVSRGFNYCVVFAKRREKSSLPIIKLREISRPASRQNFELNLDTSFSTVKNEIQSNVVVIFNIQYCKIFLKISFSYCISFQ